jgi:hypothetical protein
MERVPRHPCGPKLIVRQQPELDTAGGEEARIGEWHPWIIRTAEHRCCDARHNSTE